MFSLVICCLLCRKSILCCASLLPEWRKWYICCNYGLSQASTFTMFTSRPRTETHVSSVRGEMILQRRIIQCIVFLGLFYYCLDFPAVIILSGFLFFNKFMHCPLSVQIKNVKYLLSLHFGYQIKKFSDIFKQASHDTPAW